MCEGRVRDRCECDEYVVRGCECVKGVCDRVEGCE